MAAARIWHLVLIKKILKLVLITKILWGEDQEVGDSERENYDLYAESIVRFSVSICIKGLSFSLGLPHSPPPLLSDTLY